jgi:hypothetical protein
VGTYLGPEESSQNWLTIKRVNFSSIKLIRNKIRERKPRVIVVASNSQILTPLIRLCAFVPIVLDAGWLLSDANFTRGRRIQNWKDVLLNWLFDYIAFAAASHIFVESPEQKDRCIRLRLSSEKKVSVLFTGVNESRFSETQEEKPPELVIGEKPLIFFRGKYNLESGLDFFNQCAAEISKFAKVVIATNHAFRGSNICNDVVLIQRDLKDSELKYLYKHSKLAIGQLSDHKRIKYTIPHKFFEAAYFGIPYLTLLDSAVNNLCKGEGLLLLRSLRRSEVVATVQSVISDVALYELKHVQILSFYKEVEQDQLSREFYSKIRNIIQYVENKFD